MHSQFHALFIYAVSDRNFTPLMLHHCLTSHENMNICITIIKAAFDKAAFDIHLGSYDKSILVPTSRPTMYHQVCSRDHQKSYYNSRILVSTSELVDRNGLSRDVASAIVSEVSGNCNLAKPYM